MIVLYPGINITTAQTFADAWEMKRNQVERCQWSILSEPRNERKK